jgi:hypothetical protein
MRAAPSFSVLSATGRRLAAVAVLACCCAGAWGQQAPVPLPVDAPPPGATPKVEQKVERIRVEDAGSRIDEVRYGGQTQSITVQPKVGNVPEYSINPTDGARRAPAGRDGTETGTGSRVWNVLGF